MGGLFGGGASVSQTTPVITSIRLQTSAYGTSLPIAYGRMRIPPNLMQYADFKAIAHTESAGGGKGGGGGAKSTSYTYQAAILMQICEGPIADVPRAYVGKNKYKLAKLGLSLFYGTEEQEPFGYMVSKHPSKALHYPAVAYVAAGAYNLGESAELNNHNFDVICNPAFRIANEGIGKRILKVFVRQGVQYWNRVSSADVQYSTDGVTWTTAQSLTLPNDDSGHAFVVAAPEGVKTRWRLVATSGLQRFIGEYTVGVQYLKDDIVSYSGAYWRVLANVKNVAPAPQVAREVTRKESGEDGRTYTETVYIGSWRELPASECRWALASVGLYPAIDKSAVNLAVTDRAEGNALSGYSTKYAFDGNVDTEWRSAEQGADVNGNAWVGQYFGLWDVSPADVVTDILSNSRYGAGYPVSKIGALTNFRDYTIAANLLVSPCYRDQRSTQEIIKELAMVGNSGLVHSEGVLKIIPYGDEELTANGVAWTPDLTVQYDLDDDDFQPDEGEDPVLCTRSSPADAYNHVRVKFSNRENAYAVEIAEAKDQADIELNGLREMETINLENIICDAAVAKNIADIVLRRSLFVRNLYEFRLGWNYCRLEPMDIVSLTDSLLGLYLTPVRVTEIEEDEDGLLSLKAEDLIVGAGSSASLPTPDVDGYNPDFNVMPGDTTSPVFVNAPGNLTVSGYELWLATAGKSAYWGGCFVHVSFDGVSYTNVGAINGGARIGMLTASLMASGSDIDSTGVLSVDFSDYSPNSTISSVSQDDFDNLVTLCKIDGELLAYRDATLTGTANYDMTYLIRGAYQSTNQTHAQGAQFVRIDDRVFKYAYEQDYFGKPVWIKLQSFNIYGGGVQDIDQVQAYQTVLGTSASYPPDVKNFVAAQNGQAVLFQWGLLTANNVAGYEIRFNEKGIQSWDDATPVTQVTRGTQITTVKVPPGDWTFLIAAKDTSGNYSQVKGIYDLMVSNSNDVIYTREEALFWETGTLTNAVVHQPTRKLIPQSGGTAESYAWDTFDIACPEPPEKFGYEAQEIDLGTEGAVRVYGITLSHLLPEESGIADPEVLMDYKTIDGSYRGFQAWGIGTFTARYIKQKFEAYTNRGLCAVGSFSPYIDAERRGEEYFNVNIPASGYALTFAKEFFKQPAVSGTVVSATAATLIITSQSKTGASLTVTNASGTAIAGSANIQIKGV